MAGSLRNGDWVRINRDWARFDADQTMELRASPIRLLWGAAFASIGLGATVWALANEALPPIVYLCAWVGAIGCAFVLALMFVRALTIRQPVITLSSDGFLDIRISSAVVPWKLIREISVGTIRGSSYYPRDSKALFLYLPASSWQNLPLKRFVRWMLPLILNRAHGYEGLAIGHGEFDTSFDTFSAVVTAYAEARGVNVDRLAGL